MIFNIPVGGKRTAVVSVYGAAGETVTLTHSNGTVYSFAANGAGTKEIPVGTYTVYGSKSKYSKTAVVTKDTGRINAWPDGATIYYWYGYAPQGTWQAVAALPATSPYKDNPTLPTASDSANSVYIQSAGDYARGGSAYLPKQTIGGAVMHLVCSGAANNYYLALNITESISNWHTPAKITEISTGSTEKTLDVSSIAGGSYYPAISLNTSRYETGSKPSYITVHALYSV